MKKILVFALLISINLFGQTAGLSGLSFLKNGFGARNIAMGDFGAAGTNDLTSLNYNPSLLAVKERTQLFFSNNSLYNDLSSKQFAASMNVFGLSMAVGINSTNISGLEVRSKPGEPESTFSANYFSSGISAALPITGNLFAGATIKYLYESLFTDDASGIAFDFGVTLTSLIEGLNVGASIRNIGKMNNLRAEATKLPTDILAGASYKFNLTSLNLEIDASAGIQKYNSADKLQMHGGAEFLYSKTIAVRLGYMSGLEEKSFTSGFGVIWNRLNIDYAYVPVKYNLGNSHIISLIYTFD